MTIKKINSLSDFFNLLINTNVMRGEFCFRGHANCEWRLEPSLFRGRPKEEIVQLQTASFRPLLTNPGSIPYIQSLDPVAYLMTLQHFGIPTTLLDVSLDPLVALFFSCYDPRKENINSDAMFYTFPLDGYDKVKMDIPPLDVFRKKMDKKEIQEEFPKRIFIDYHQFLEPLFKNPRMRSQDGAFFMFSTSTLPDKPEKCLSLDEFLGVKNQWLEHQGVEHKMWFGNILIEKSAKTRILNELDREYNINEDSLLNHNDYVSDTSDFFLKLKSTLHDSFK